MPLGPSSAAAGVCRYLPMSDRFTIGSRRCGALATIAVIMTKRRLRPIKALKLHLFWDLKTICDLTQHLNTVDCRLMRSAVALTGRPLRRCSRPRISRHSAALSGAGCERQAADDVVTHYRQGAEGDSPVGVAEATIVGEEAAYADHLLDGWRCCAGRYQQFSRVRDQGGRAAERATHRLDLDPPSGRQSMPRVRRAWIGDICQPAQTLTSPYQRCQWRAISKAQINPSHPALRGIFAGWRCRSGA